MGADSKIEWTHHTFNPWWGCVRVSPGCEHCYAEAFAKRVGVKWGVHADRRFFGDKHWAEPLKWNRDAERAGERRRVFCASMADVFEDREDLVEPRARLFRLIEDTPHLDWLLLTKRPENAGQLWAGAQVDAYDGSESLGPTWARNVWLGTTVEDQRRADERIPHLLRTPAVVRFLSCEPLLGPVNLHLFLCRYASAERPEQRMSSICDGPTDRRWVIVGGESGHGARPFDLEWARSIVRQCRDAGVPVHVKQLGAKPAMWANVHGAPGYVSALRLSNKKGGDWSEWPEDLRVREYPEPRS